MNSRALKFVMALIVLFVLIYAGANLYNSAKNDYATEEAVEYTVNENIYFDGVFIRDETVVTYNGEGVIDYVNPDGSKLSNSSVIADVYDDESRIIAKDRIEQIEKEISNLERAQNPGTTNYAKPESVKSQIDDKYTLLASYLQNGDLSSARTVQSSLLFNMNVYSVVTQTDTDFESRINELEIRIAQYQEQYAEPQATITTDHTGYFVSVTDGYEGVVSMSDIDNLSPVTVQNIIDGKGAENTENAIGKIYDSYECYIAGIVKQSNKLLKNDTLKVRLGNSESVYDVTIYNVINTDDENCMLILQCDAIDEFISRERVERVELIFQEYTGLKVPRDAIRFLDVTETVPDENGLETEQTVEYKGVYVMLGQEVTFKKIDVIYEGDNFVISDNVSDTEYLNLYDRIITEEVKDKDVS